VKVGVEGFDGVKVVDLLEIDISNFVEEGSLELRIILVFISKIIGNLNERKFLNLFNDYKLGGIIL
jgi:hypothetical protein